MKKSKISLGIVAGLASVAALASCSQVKPKASSEGYVLTYTNSSGTTFHYTSEELFGSYFTQSSSIASMFDKVYSLIIRNYFKVEDAGKSKYTDIKKDAENDVEGVRTTAKKNAESNKTSYSEEFDKLLESYSCEDEEELLEHFIYDREKTEFEKQFYDNKTIFGDKTGIEYLRDHKAESTKDFSGYLERKVPYHVRHILVKFDGSTSNDAYWNDTINDKDAKNLLTVARSLAEGQLDFGQIAQNSSEFSDGSAANYGELEIVDKDTSYVNEFKLGIYAYENLYGANQEEAKASEISIDYNATHAANFKYKDIVGQKGLDIAGKYAQAVTYERNAAKKDLGGDAAGKIATIPYGAFIAMNKWATTTNTSIGEVVNENNSAFYPRNVIYNKYLNRHNVAFITPYDIPANDDEVTEDTFDFAKENTVGKLSDTFVGMKGFQDVIIDYDETSGDPIKQKVLCTKDGKPILVVRAGTSDYKGVHFMVVERSGLVDTEANPLSDYYSVVYKKDDPKFVANSYVNFLNQKEQDLMSRAQTVEGKIKNFDSSNLNKLIYSKYVERQKLSIGKIKVTTVEGKEVEYDLGAQINEWIERDRNNSLFNTANTWEETWESYINTLNQQKVERRKLVSEACAIGFTTKNSSKGANWTVEGGACYVPTQK